MDWRLAHAWLHGYSSARAGEEADGSRWDSVPGGVAAFERGRKIGARS